MFKPKLLFKGQMELLLYVFITLTTFSQSQNEVRQDKANVHVLALRKEKGLLVC